MGVSCEMPLGYEDLVLEIFGRRCVACGRPGNLGDDLVLDHHQPLCEGNALLHNAVPLCWSCNISKGGSQPEDFYEFSKFMEIEVLLRDARDVFEMRFGTGAVT